MNKPSLPVIPGFTDAQLDEVFRLAAPIDRRRRDAFLKDLVLELEQAPRPLGDGFVYRVAREVQRRHFDPPDFSVAGAPAKWER
jgi:hypothetical protein